MSFKLGQLIEHNEQITWWKFKKKLFYFFELLPLANLDIENFDISKTITAMSFKLGQVILNN